MYRQIIIPYSKSYLLNLPANFIGRQVEITAETIKSRKKNIRLKKIENFTANSDLVLFK